MPSPSAIPEPPRPSRARGRGRAGATAELPADASDDLLRLDLTAELFPESRQARPVLRHGTPGDAASMFATLDMRGGLMRQLVEGGLFASDPDLAPLRPNAKNAPKLYAALARRLDAMLEHEQSRVWVAHVQGSTVGFASLRWYHDPMSLQFVAWLDALYVHPTWRQRGVGTQLLNACRASARVADVAELHLNALFVWVKPSLLPFFENRGFVHVGLGYRRTP